MANSLIQSTAKKKEENRLQLQQYEIQKLFREANGVFNKDFFLDTSMSEKGELNWLGVISDSLDGRLTYLVDDYNSDPSTSAPITVEEARHSFTEGVSDVAAHPDSHLAFVAFLQWCGSDVVFVEEDGSVYVMKGFSNYLYVAQKELWNEHGMFAYYEQNK